MMVTLPLPPLLGGITDVTVFFAPGEASAVCEDMAASDAPRRGVGVLRGVLVGVRVGVIVGVFDAVGVGDGYNAACTFFTGPMSAMINIVKMHKANVPPMPKTKPRERIFSAFF